MVILPAMYKYQRYKDSGIEWLAEIPEHWNIKRFRNLFSFSKGLSITKENLQDEGIPCVNYGEIHSKYGFEVDPDKNELHCVGEDYLKRSPKSLLNRGDFIFADTSEDIEGSGNFTHLTSDKDVFAGYHTVIARPIKGINKRFLAYVCDSISYRSQIRSKVKGVKVYSITKAILKGTWIWLPNEGEQTVIANFLDKKTAKIDKAIAIKEQQIVLLKERKQIIIQKSVTKGLNLNVPTKDTGVDWIGRIPEHWDIKRAKYLFKEVDQRSKTGQEELLSVSHMTGVTPRSEKNVSMFMAEDYTGSKICIENDLVINIMWAWMGALGVSDRIGIVSPSYGVFRQQNKNTFNPVYLEYLLKTTKYIEHYNQVSTGLHSSRLRFYGHMFLNMKMGFPSFDEQNSIVAYLSEQTDKIDKAINVQESQIEKLKEYKTTLINNAVTGKIKVA
ncbi:restriction endonuclease subunit S [Desulfotignum phosphitoxidans]|uniref:Type I restriction enzyme protein HsdS n=1 Tax=Desulfotignum phosphitoxidans DSM 13687 TaxID=1286635 RepID=S0G3M8_9BACT|nr:restriction endonuclease subunit S [Desulfotignum phosphitoxidans]EMS78421.1 type I restriction enzyme protein HsdS [Desulfotignum phosphitoxidans DSM 13687]